MPGTHNVDIDYAALYRQGIERIYGSDPREMPLYGFGQAARYLSIPVSTLKSWVRGRKYPVGQEGQLRYFKPIITPPDPELPMLSFINLVEAHVLSGMRRIERLPFINVRSALEYVEREMDKPHPLATQEFETDGVHLFVRHLNELIKVSDKGQYVIEAVVSAYLRRIRRDRGIGVTGLYPFLRPHAQSLTTDVIANEPEKVIINPLVSFGRPVLVGTGVPTDVVSGRFLAGESIEALARDYGISPEQVEEAVRYESPTRKTA